MSPIRATLHFDFVDPLSWLLAREAAAAARPRALALAYRPLELRPPPHPLIAIDDDSLAARWKLARDLASQRGITFAPPRLVPWSRKAHELHLLAIEHDAGEAVREALFEAYLLRGRDIGRVDVLVEVGQSAGLDRTETKAVLDVDRFEAEITGARASATDAGIGVVPTFVVGSSRLEGFHNRTTLRTFLRGA